MQSNCKVIKKGSPPFHGYPHFLAKFLVSLPQVTQFLEGPAPHPPLVWGVSIYVIC